MLRLCFDPSKDVQFHVIYETSYGCDKLKSQRASLGLRHFGYLRRRGGEKETSGRRQLFAWDVYFYDHYQHFSKLSLTKTTK